MAIDDRIDLVGTLSRLVHALRKAGDDLFFRAEQLKEARDLAFVETGGCGGCGNVGRDFKSATSAKRTSWRNSSATVGAQSTIAHGDIAVPVPQAL